MPAGAAMQAGRGPPKRAQFAQQEQKGGNASDVQPENSQSQHLAEERSAPNKLSQKSFFDVQAKVILEENSVHSSLKNDSFSEDKSRRSQAARSANHISIPLKEGSQRKMNNKSQRYILRAMEESKQSAIQFKLKNYDLVLKQNTELQNVIKKLEAKMLEKRQLGSEDSSTRLANDEQRRREKKALADAEKIQIMSRQIKQLELENNALKIEVSNQLVKNAEMKIQMSDTHKLVEELQLSRASQGVEAENLSLIKRLSELQDDLQLMRTQKESAEKVVSELCEKMNQVLALNDSYSLKLKQNEQQSQQQLKALQN